MLPPRPHLLALTLLAFSPLACKKTPNYAPSEAQVQADRLGKLRNEIQAMTPARGCSKAAECKIAGVGFNRCGGPRQHVVYCPGKTDASALQSKLDELSKLEEEEEKKKGEPPPCKKAQEPQIEFVDGSCRAK